MIPDIALDKPMAEDIVRRCGLTMGGAIQALFVDWLDPPELQSPPLPFNTGGTIARRVQQPTAEDWYSGSKFLPPGSTPSVASRIMPPGVTWWRRGVPTGIGFRNNNSWRWNWLNFEGYGRTYVGTGYQRPPARTTIFELPAPTIVAYSGASPPPGYPGWPFGEQPGSPIVTGRTMYDPFPYPDAPLYFWADLADCRRLVYFVMSQTGFPGGGGGGSSPEYGFGEGPGSGIPSSVNDTAVPREYTNNIDKAILFKLWYSDDMGVTWKPPFLPIGSDDPVSPHHNDYPANGTAWLNVLTNVGLPTYRPHDSRIHPEPGPALTSGVLHPEARKDGLLFKITLQTPRTDTWIQFKTVGIGFGIDEEEWSERGTPGG